MDKECFKCGTNEGMFIPLPGSPVDEETGLPQDYICDTCYQEISGRLEAARGLQALRGEYPGDTLEIDAEYAALQGDFPIRDVRLREPGWALTDEDVGFFNRAYISQKRLEEGS